MPSAAQVLAADRRRRDPLRKDRERNCREAEVEADRENEETLLRGRWQRPRLRFYVKEMPAKIKETLTA